MIPLPRSLSAPSTDNPLRLLLWPLVTAALLVVLLTLVAVCICHYMKAGKGVNTPEMLVRNISAK